MDASPSGDAAGETSGDHPADGAPETPPSRKAQIGRHTLIIASAFGVGLLVVALAVGFWTWSGGPRSDLAGWLEGTSTLAAFMAAAVAAWYAAGVFKLETKRKENWDRDQKKAQAALMHCWYATKEVDGVTEHGVYVLNASNAPFTMVEVWPSLKNESLENIVIGNLGPTAAPRWFPFSPSDQPVIEAAEYGVVPDTFMHMVDVNDRDWYRSSDGYLRRPSNPTGEYN